MTIKSFQGCISTKNIEAAYAHLTDVVASESFLNNQGLNNDIPFHICPFKPEARNQVQLLVRQLISYLGDIDIGKQVLEINLYDLVVDILESEGDWEWLIRNEHSLTRSVLKDELQTILDVETVLIPAIVERMNQNSFDVLFITGVGEVFPYTRSHNILNNLQPYAKEKPTLMFFPGIYKHSLEKGASLELFGRITDDRYYRAFNILDRAI